jgi:hypothetical protein
MNRQVGPYSTLITPQAGSLFHAVLHARTRRRWSKLREWLSGGDRRSGARSLKDSDAQESENGHGANPP